ncbi:MAG: D-TA family PLP-dependent enzyme [Verrucomicrobiae bacterium]|nr:D-TA family PLP-dependent enzyme [Verrucomicrobiae bacterium]
MDDWYRITGESEVASPALLIHPDRIAENLRRLLATVGGDPARLRPHVKTHKLAPVIALHLDVGINRFKASTIAECEMVAAAGGTDVLLAHPMVGPTVNRFVELQRAYPRVRFRGMVDHPDTLEAIRTAAGRLGGPIRLLVDLDVGMHRTGIAPGEAAFDLACRIHQDAALEFDGLHVYDGHLAIPEVQKRRAAWNEAGGPVWTLRDRLESAGVHVPRIVGGGTPTLPFFAERPDVECSAGTVVLWDFGQPLQDPDLDFLNAAVLLTRVISRPGPRRLCLDLGHKAVASEMAPPRVRLFGLEEATLVGHSEEHLVLETPEPSALASGTVVYGIPRHVCPTVALYSEVLAVRDHQVTDRWPVTARTRRITI